MDHVKHAHIRRYLEIKDHVLILNVHLTNLFNQMEDVGSVSINYYPKIKNPVLSHCVREMK